MFLLNPLYQGQNWFIKMDMPFIAGDKLSFFGTIYAVNPTPYIVVLEGILQKIKQLAPSLLLKCLNPDE